MHTAAMPAPDLPPSPSPRETRLRTRYLRDVERDVVGRLNASLHHARFLDLGIEDDPAAVKPPWGYYNPEEKESYGSVRDAFEQSDRRLLLLGDPGAGKTTAVLHIALDLLRAAEQSAGEPLPLIVNLSKFRLPKPSQGRFSFITEKSSQQAGSDAGRKRAFENWLIGELAAYPGLSQATAREWLYEGRIAAILDGLDEFNDEQRAELAATLNDTFLRDHPDLPVVICSRTNEYKVLASNEKSRLQLRAAVHLQPLSEPQVAAYLKAAKAEGLLEALADDAALRELSRTPLTLSMLVLAYGGRAPTRPLGKAGFGETRLRLFEAYVERMLQRQARRRCDRPFDDVSANDVPVRDYRYRPDSMNRWLGWLAVTLSVRMRTTFSTGAIDRILLAGNDPGRQRLNFCFAYWSIGALLAVCLAALAIPIVPRSPGPVGAAAALIVTGWLLLPLVGTVRSEWTPGIALAVVIWGIAILAPVALLSSMLAEMAPAISAYMLPAVLLSATFTTWLFLDDLDDDLIAPMMTGTVTAGALVAGLALWPYPIELLGGWVGPVWSQVLAGTLVWVPVVAAFIIGLAMGGAEDEWLMIVGAIAGVAASSLGMTWLLSEVNWITVLAAATFGAAAISATLEPRRGIVTVVLALPLAVAGGALGGARAMFIVLALCAAGAAVVYWVLDDAGRDRIGQFFDRLFESLDSLVLSRLLWLFLAAAGRFPLRKRPFLASAVDAFLLKRSGFEFEFVHRLLRDHFALRQLVPKLQSDGAAKLEVVRTLGYQGEAALELLIEYADQGDAALRAAAVAALAHIPSPSATGALRRRMYDGAPEVRYQLIMALPKLPSEDQTRFLTEMPPLGHRSEVSAILKAFDGWRSIRAAPFMRRLGPSAIRPLVQALKQGSMKSRISAADYLASIRDERVVEALIDQLGSRNAALRGAVVKALSNQAVSAEVFERALNDRSRRVRAAARVAHALFMSKRPSGMVESNPQAESGWARIK